MGISAVASCTTLSEGDTDATSIIATEASNIYDLKDVVIEINQINLTDRQQLANAPSAVLGSWHTTPDAQKLEVLLAMYGHGRLDQDDQDFNTAIENDDRSRTYFYTSKIEAIHDIDNSYENRHMMCSHPENIKPEEDKINCMTLNVNKREYYSLSWEEIAEAALQDEFLV